MLLSIEIYQFFRFANREIVWSYPTNHDQLAYLDLSYRTYQAMRHEGLIRGIADATGIAPDLVPLSAQGAIFHVQAALLYCLVGPSRQAAISLNLIYWLTFQVVFSPRTLRENW